MKRPSPQPDHDPKRRALLKAGLGLLAATNALVSGCVRFNSIFNRPMIIDEDIIVIDPYKIESVEAEIYHEIADLLSWRTLQDFPSFGFDPKTGQIDHADIPAIKNFISSKLGYKQEELRYDKATNEFSASGGSPIISISGSIVRLKRGDFISEKIVMNTHGTRAEGIALERIEMSNQGTRVKAWVRYRNPDFIFDEEPMIVEDIQTARNDYKYMIVRNSDGAIRLIQVTDDQPSIKHRAPNIYYYSDSQIFEAHDRKEFLISS